MEENTSMPSVPTAKASQIQDAANTTLTKSQDEAPKEQRGESLEKAIQAADRVGGEQRKAYGTAKTEDLRDSGLWRIILPAFIILSCLAILAIPLIILGWLLVNSLDVHAASNTIVHVPLVWVWIVMAIIEVGIAVVVGRGLLRIFLTQAENYRR